MSDYYDPHPRLRLSRPVVLAGDVGCGAAAVAWQIAAQTGIGFVSIDRLIEHEAGCELARLAVEEGTTRLVARTDAVLNRVANETPFGIVVIDRAWPSQAVRDTLRRRTLFAHLARPYDHLLRHFDEELRRAGDWILRGLVPSNDGPVGLREVCAHRATLLREAELVFEAGDLHVHRIAEQLLESLEQLVDA